MNHYSLHIKVVTALKQSCFRWKLYYDVNCSRQTSIICSSGPAFDTVDLKLLFSRLKDMFGQSGKVRQLFRSYLEQRSQRVSVHGVLIWCLVLIVWCTTGLLSWSSDFNNVCPSQWFGVIYHFYADNTPLYI